jgi:hypothetical protein
LNILQRKSCTIQVMLANSLGLSRPTGNPDPVSWRGSARIMSSLQTGIAWEKRTAMAKIGIHPDTRVAADGAVLDEILQPDGTSGTPSRFCAG